MAGPRAALRRKQNAPGPHVRGRANGTDKGLGGVLIAGGRRRRGRTRTARQREGLALIERADAALVEASFLDLQIGTIERIGRQLLDRETHGLSRCTETPIGKTRPLLLADRGGEKFGGGVEVERTHGAHGRGPLVFLALALAVGDWPDAAATGGRPGTSFRP